MADGGHQITSKVEGLKAVLSETLPAFLSSGNEGRRQLMVYSGPQQRTDNCRHCALVGHTLLNCGSFSEREEFHCKVGGFKVAVGGVCENWMKAK